MYSTSTSGANGFTMFSKAPLRVPSRTLSTKARLNLLCPTPTEITEAIAKLSATMYEMRVIYGLIGGSAVLSYADFCGLPRRLTTDIDLIIQPDLKRNIDAEEVSKRLCSEEFKEDFAVKRVDGVNKLQVRVKRGEMEVLVDIDIYDHYLWPERRADYDMRLAKNKPKCMVIDREFVVLLNAPWMLRQKILIWSEREGRKRVTDKMDVETLCDVLSQARMTLKISRERDIRKLREFLKDFEQDHDPAALRTVIDCPQVLGPWYDMKWVRRMFAGFLLIAVPLAFDYFTSD